MHFTARTLWQGDQDSTSVEYKSSSGCTRVEQKSIMLDKNAGAFDPPIACVATRSAIFAAARLVDNAARVGGVVVLLLL